uniref:HCO3_cotransp domain-containing protein n=1 Tax=Macrostomum lignano TaxID=282301 RepID=A0A1I8FTZ3_9PLAT
MTLNFDDLLKQIGGFGRAQLLIFLVPALIAILSGFHTLAPIYLLYTPEYSSMRCLQKRSVGRRHVDQETCNLRERFMVGVFVTGILLNPTSGAGSRILPVRQLSMALDQVFLHTASSARWERSLLASSSRTEIVGPEARFQTPAWRN